MIYEQVKFCDPWAYERMLGSHILHTEYGPGFPDKLEYGGYNDIWKRAVANDPHGPVLESK